MSTNAAMSMKATIVMPKTAPIVKKNAVKAYGATIVEVENTSDARQSKADELVAQTGAIFLHPSENPLVIAGQGTAGLELVEQVRELANAELDAVIIPVGGGGLAAGNAKALRGLLGDKVKV